MEELTSSSHLRTNVQKEEAVEYPHCLVRHSLSEFLASRVLCIAHIRTEEPLSEGPDQRCDI